MRPLWGFPDLNCTIDLDRSLEAVTIEVSWGPGDAGDASSLSGRLDLKPATFRPPVDSRTQLMRPWASPAATPSPSVDAL